MSKVLSLKFVGKRSDTCHILHSLQVQLHLNNPLNIIISPTQVYLG